MLTNAGVDVLCSGSSRTDQHCGKNGLSMKEINKEAGWSSFKTFAKHFNNPIVDESGSFSRAALQS